MPRTPLTVAPSLRDYRPNSPRYEYQVRIEDNGILGWHFCHPSSLPVHPDDASLSLVLPPAPGYIYANTDLSPQHPVICSFDGFHAALSLKYALQYRRCPYYSTTPHHLRKEMPCRRIPSLMLCRTLSFGRITISINDPKLISDYRLILWMFDTTPLPRDCSTTHIKSYIKMHPKDIIYSPTYDPYFIPGNAFAFRTEP